MRVNYQILLKLGDKWKDISGKKLILASAPGIPKKNYDNCQIFMSKTNINDVVYIFSVDLKIKYMISGIKHFFFNCPF